MNTVLRSAGIVIIAILIFSLIHEVGHWLAFTLCHWDLRQAGYYATITLNLPWGFATVPNLKLSLFDPVVYLGGLLILQPFYLVHRMLPLEVRVALYGITAYALLEVVAFFLGVPLGGVFR